MANRLSMWRKIQNKMYKPFFDHSDVRVCHWQDVSQGCNVELWLVREVNVDSYHPYVRVFTGRWYVEQRIIYRGVGMLNTASVYRSHTRREDDNICEVLADWVDENI